MRIYMRNGVELGWLIHPDQGEGAVNGFQLDLQPIWEGLNIE